VERTTNISSLRGDSSGRTLVLREERRAGREKDLLVRGNFICKEAEGERGKKRGEAAAPVRKREA